MHPTHSCTTWPVAVDFDAFRLYVEGYTAAECADAVLQASTSAERRAATSPPPRRSSASRRSWDPATNLAALLRASDDCRASLHEEVREQFTGFRQLEARDEFLNDPRSFLATNVGSISQSHRGRLLVEYYTIEPIFFAAVFGAKLPCAAGKQIVAAMWEQLASHNDATLQHRVREQLRPAFVQRQADNLNRIAAVVFSGYGKRGAFSADFSCVDAIAENFQLPLRLSWQYATLLFASHHRLGAALCFQVAPGAAAQAVAHLLMASLCTESQLFIDAKLQQEVADVAKLLGDSRVLAEIVAIVTTPPLAAAACSAAGASTLVAAAVLAPADERAASTVGGVTGAASGSQPPSLLRRADSFITMGSSSNFAPAATLSSASVTVGAGASSSASSSAPPGAFATTSSGPSSSSTHLQTAMTAAPLASSSSGSVAAGGSGHAVVSAQLVVSVVKCLSRACYFLHGGVAAMHLVTKNVVGAFVAELQKLFVAGGAQDDHAAHPNVWPATAGGAAATGSATPQHQNQHQQPQALTAPHSGATAAGTHQQQPHCHAASLVPAATLLETRRVLLAIKKAVAAPSVAALSVGIVGDRASFAKVQTQDAASRVLTVASVMCTILHAALE